MPWRKILKIVYPTDLITLAYILITGIFIILSGFKLTDINTHLSIRIGFVLIITLLIYLDFYFPNRVIRFLRIFYPLALLGYFYPEIDYLNNVFFNNMDPQVANLEITIFGGHPSVWFSEYFPWKWFNELMNFSYFSYYFLIFLVAYWVYKKNPEKFPFVMFIICMSFYIYYFIFILFPVAGPQFYLTPPDNQLPDAYLFREAIKFVHSIGERPAAAFPSSHVGIMCILLYLSYKFARNLLKWLIPISILLILSTVYIKAHYVIDVIGGFLTVPVIYWIGSQTYSTIIHGMSQEIKIQAIYEKLKTSVVQSLNKLNKKSEN
jgi:membrane-associated phospholipid phosphatase